jgi:hypothetical protein
MSLVTSCGVMGVGEREKESFNCSKFSAVKASLGQCTDSVMPATE